MTPVDPEETKEAVKEAFKEITGEHKAYRPANGNGESKAVMRILLTVLGVLTGAVVTTIIGFTKSCSTIEVVEKFATKSEMQSLDKENSQAHAVISTKLEGIEKTTSAILDTVIDLKRSASPAKAKRRGPNE